MSYKLPKNRDKSKYVEEKFDVIAKKYDLFNDLITFGLHRYWKKFMVRQAGLTSNEECLDLCCGTGDICREILRQHPECRITGLDFSREMLKIAESKNPSNPTIEYLQGDAMKLPFPDTYFDAVTMGYGLRNVSNLNNCLKNIFSVLKPGGVFVNLDVGKVRLPMIDGINKFYFFRVVPMIGNILIKGEEMFQYLPNSSLKYPNQELLKKVLLDTGFKQVDIYDFIFGASTVHVAYKAN